MAEQLGKIERPAAKDFREGKKIYAVPLIYSHDDAPAEYKEKCSRYWQQVAGQVANLETKIGQVKLLYHESVYESGEKGMEIVKGLNPDSYQIARARCDNGAAFEAIEDGELAEETMDWERHIFLGFMSQKVANKVYEIYSEASKKRYEFMAQKISDTLKGSEAGLLFIREGHSLQFPGDVEVFSVSPPALDEIHRWLRDQTRAKQQEAVQKREQAEGKGEKVVEKPKVEKAKRKRTRRKKEEAGG